MGTKNPNATHSEIQHWQNRCRRQAFKDLEPHFWLLPLLLHKASQDETTEDHLRTMSIMEGTGLGWWDSNTQEMRMH